MPTPLTEINQIKELGNSIESLATILQHEITLKGFNPGDMTSRYYDYLTLARADADMCLGIIDKLLG